MPCPVGKSWYACSVLELKSGYGLARALSPSSQQDAETPVELVRQVLRFPSTVINREGAGRLVKVPSEAPQRPKPRGLQICLEHGNVTAFAHLMQSDTAASQTLPLKPLHFAIDILVSKAWEAGRCLSALSAMILSLIENKVDVNETAERGETPLHALQRLVSDREVVKLCKARLAVAMLRAKADPNSTDKCGDSPLLEAAAVGDLEMCKLLLEHGARARAPQSGLDPEVHQLLQEAAERQQSMLSSLISTGFSYLQQDPVRAVSCFADALALDPLNPDVLQAAAEAEYVAGNFPSAYQHASRSVATNPLQGSAYATCAQALWQLNRVQEALAVIELLPEAASSQSVAEISTRILRHWSCIDGVENLVSDKPNPNLVACGAGLQEVEALLEEMAPQEQVSPWGVRVRLILVQLCIFLSQPENTRHHWTTRALSETKQLRKVQGKCGRVLYWHARALLQAGCREDAINALRCASQLPGGDEGFLNNLLRADSLRNEGEVAAAQNRWAAALEYFENAESCGACDPDSHALLLAEKAMAKFKLKRCGEALRDVSAGLDMVSSFARLHLIRGLIHMDLEMYPQAAADFDRVAATNPTEMCGELHERARRWARTPPVPDHYAALGLFKAATSKEIKKAYRLAALQWHPDKNVGNETRAEQVFKQIQAAFDVLSCESSRKKYDDYPGDRRPFEVPPCAPEPSPD